MTQVLFISFFVFIFANAWNSDSGSFGLRGANNRPNRELKIGNAEVVDTTTAVETTMKAVDPTMKAVETAMPAVETTMSAPETNACKDHDDIVFQHDGVEHTCASIAQEADSGGCTSTMQHIKSEGGTLGNGITPDMKLIDICPVVYKNLCQTCATECIKISGFPEVQASCNGIFQPTVRKNGLYKNTKSRYAYIDGTSGVWFCDTDGDNAAAMAYFSTAKLPATGGYYVDNGWSVAPNAKIENFDCPHGPTTWKVMYKGVGEEEKAAFESDFKVIEEGKCLGEQGTEIDCKAAAKALGQEYHKSGRSSRWPTGCLWSEKQRKFWYNTRTTRKSATSHKVQICQKATSFARETHQTYSEMFSVSSFSSVQLILAAIGALGMCYGSFQLCFRKNAYLSVTTHEEV